MDDLANIFIELSRGDLKSSRILYDNRQYRTSYFFFQQAAEKANKAYGLLQEIITENDLSDIQHKQTKIHRKGLVEQEDKINKFSDAIKFFPQVENHEFLKQIDVEQYRRYLKDGLSYVDSLYNLDLVNIPSSELTDFLRFLRKLEKNREKLASKPITPTQKDEEECRIQMQSFADLVGALGTHEALQAKSELDAFLKNDEQLHQYVNALLGEALPFLTDLMFASCSLIVCAIITVQHSSLARYPDKDGNSPVDIYKKSLPVVKKQPEFMEFLRKALDILQHFAKLKTINAKEPSAGKAKDVR